MKTPLLLQPACGVQPTCARAAARRPHSWKLLCRWILCGHPFDARCIMHDARCTTHRGLWTKHGARSTKHEACARPHRAQPWGCAGHPGGVRPGGEGGPAVRGVHHLRGPTRGQSGLRGRLRRPREEDLVRHGCHIRLPSAAHAHDCTDAAAAWGRCPWCWALMHCFLRSNSADWMQTMLMCSNLWSDCVLQITAWGRGFRFVCMESYFRCLWFRCA